MSTLKKKEFIIKAKQSKDSWIVAARSGDEGLLIGWFVGFSSNDDQTVLITDKGTTRLFKTVESAIWFVAENNLTECGSVSVSYA